MPSEMTFLIVANTNRSKIPRSAPYVNGMFMETIGSPLYGYTHEQLAEIESTLLWGEQHLKAPQINWLEGWALTVEPLDSPRESTMDAPVHDNESHAF